MNYNTYAFKTFIFFFYIFVSVQIYLLYELRGSWGACIVNLGVI